MNRQRILVASLYTIALVTGLCSHVQAQVVQWDQVVAAAKKEGKVVVSIPPGAELRKSLKEVFEKRFGIELELVTGRGAAIAKKIADEFRAGLRLTDVHTGGSAPIIYGLAGMLEPVESQFILPEVKDAKLWWGGHMYVDKTKRFGYSFLAFVQDALWYHTELLKPEELRVYDDLLHPKWQNKIGYSDPRRGGAGQGNWTFLWKTKGEDFLKKLMQQNLVIMGEERPLAEALAKGSLALTIGLDIDNFISFVKSRPAGQAASPAERWNLSGDRIGCASGHQGSASSQCDEGVCQLALKQRRTINLSKCARRADSPPRRRCA